MVKKTTNGKEQKQQTTISEEDKIKIEKAVQDTVNELDLDAMLETVVKKLAEARNSSLNKEAIETAKKELKEGVDRDTLIKFAQLLQDDEINLDLLVPKASSSIHLALTMYDDSNKTDIFKTFLNYLPEYSVPSAKTQSKANNPYRIEIGHNRAYFQSGNLFNVFIAHRFSEGDIDINSLRSKLRRLDLEVNLLDQLTKLGLIDNFSENILSNMFSVTSKVSYRPTPNEFGIELESWILLSDLSLMYSAVKNNAALMEINSNVRLSEEKQFNSLFLEPQSTTRLSNFTYGVPHNRRLLINDNGYILLKQLLKAFHALLPTDLQDQLYDHKLVLGNKTANGYRELSGKLRNAFISIVQGAGSFLVFFELLYEFYQKQEQELNKNVIEYAAFVWLFDTIGLEIPKLLTESKDRIMDS